MFKTTLITTALILCAVHGAVAAPNPLARDLVQISKLFSGEFDNDAQIWFEQDHRWQGDESEKQRRNHAIHRKVKFPKFGEHVFYVEEFFDNDVNQVWRRRLVAFDADSDKGLRMKIYFVGTPLEINDPDLETKLAKLKAKKLTHLPGCDVYFNRVADQFEGRMEPKACVFGDGEKRRYSEHNLVISEEKYWRIDRTFLMSDNSLHAGIKGDVPTKMRRARQYLCDISMPYESYAKPNDKDVSIKGLLVHDQGGTITFENPRTSTMFDLQLREKEYPYYTEGSDFFLLRIKEQGAKFSTALVTTALRPERVSVNTGGISAFCQQQ